MLQAKEYCTVFSSVLSHFFQPLGRRYQQAVMEFEMKIVNIVRDLDNLSQSEARPPGHSPEEHLYHCLDGTPGTTCSSTELDPTHRVGLRVGFWGLAGPNPYAPGLTLLAKLVNFAHPPQFPTTQPDVELRSRMLQTLQAAILPGIYAHLTASELTFACRVSREGVECRTNVHGKDPGVPAEPGESHGGCHQVH